MKFAMKFYGWEVGLDLHCLKADRIWTSTPQIADDADFFTGYMSNALSRLSV